jgi:nucleoid DNA-binding protein
MNDTITNGTMEPDDQVDEQDVAGKEDIYLKIKELVKTKTGGKNIGKSGGREVFDLVVAEIFTLATKAGTIRLNGGFGSFHVRHYTSGERRLPSGQNVTFGERDKLRYEEGVVVKALVNLKGDLNEAIKVRGSRTRDGEDAELETDDLPHPATRGRASTSAGVELD